MCVALAAMFIPATQLLTSCGDDDDDPKSPEDKTVRTVKVEYDVDFSDVVYNYCDVKVEYVDADGSIVSVPGNVSADYEKEIMVPANLANRPYYVKVTLALKENYPQIDDNRVYEIDRDIEVDITKLNAKGQEIGSKSSQMDNTQKVNGVNLIQTLYEMTVKPYSVTLDYPF